MRSRAAPGGDRPSSRTSVDTSGPLMTAPAGCQSRGRSQKTSGCSTVLVKGKKRDNPATCFRNVGTVIPTCRASSAWRHRRLSTNACKMSIVVSAALRRPIRSGAYRKCKSVPRENAVAGPWQIGPATGRPNRADVGFSPNGRFEPHESCRDVRGLLRAMVLAWLRGHASEGLAKERRRNVILTGSL